VTSVDPEAPVAEVEPPVADGLEHSLDPSWVELQQIVGWIVFAVLVPMLLLGIAITALLSQLSWWATGLLLVAWVGVSIGLAWLAHRWPSIEYRYFKYRLDAVGIDIRAGVVWRRLISVPRSRVQHIDVAQGPIERRYTLATLSIYTAGTEFAKVDLPGLPYARAVRIRDHLLPGHEHAADDGT
jgi:membrane protein YdbS with pleckstrin-like domain